MNVSDVLVRSRKVFVPQDSIKENTEPCPHCKENGFDFKLRFFYISFEEAIYKCANEKCLYPFERFFFRSVKDKTIYYYEEVTDAPDFLLKVQKNENHTPYHPLATDSICKSQRNANIEDFTFDFPEFFDSIDNMYTAGSSTAPTIQIEPIVGNVDVFSNVAGQSIENQANVSDTTQGQQLAGTHDDLIDEILGDLEGISSHTAKDVLNVNNDDDMSAMPIGQINSSEAIPSQSNQPTDERKVKEDVKRRTSITKMMKPEPKLSRTIQHMEKAKEKKETKHTTKKSFDFKKDNTRGKPKTSENVKQSPMPNTNDPKLIGNCVDLLNDFAGLEGSDFDKLDDILGITFEAEPASVEVIETVETEPGVMVPLGIGSISPSPIAAKLIDIKSSKPESKLNRRTPPVQKAKNQSFDSILKSIDFPVQVIQRKQKPSTKPIQPAKKAVLSPSKKVIPSRPSLRPAMLSGQIIKMDLSTSSSTFLQEYAKNKTESQSSSDEVSESNATDNSVAQEQSSASAEILMEKTSSLSDSAQDLESNCSITSFSGFASSELEMNLEEPNEVMTVGKIKTQSSKNATEPKNSSVSNPIKASKPRKKSATRKSSKASTKSLKDEKRDLDTKQEVSPVIETNAVVPKDIPAPKTPYKRNNSISNVTKNEKKNRKSGAMKSKSDEESSHAKSQSVVDEALTGTSKLIAIVIEPLAMPATKKRKVAEKKDLPCPEVSLSTGVATVTKNSAKPSEEDMKLNESSVVAGDDEKSESISSVEARGTEETKNPRKRAASRSKKSAKETVDASKSHGRRVETVKKPPARIKRVEKKSLEDEEKESLIRLLEENTIVTENDVKSGNDTTEQNGSPMKVDEKCEQGGTQDETDGLLENNAEVDNAVNDEPVKEPRKRVASIKRDDKNDTGKQKSSNTKPTNSMPRSRDEDILNHMKSMSPAKKNASPKKRKVTVNEMSSKKDDKAQTVVAAAEKPVETANEETSSPMDTEAKQSTEDESSVGIETTKSPGNSLETTTSTVDARPAESPNKSVEGSECLISAATESSTPKPLNRSFERKCRSLDQMPSDIEPEQPQILVLVQTNTSAGSVEIECGENETAVLQEDKSLCDDEPQLSPKISIARIDAKQTKLQTESSPEDSVGCSNLLNSSDNKNLESFMDEDVVEQDKDPEVEDVMVDQLKKKYPLKETEVILIRSKEIDQAARLKRRKQTNNEWKDDTVPKRKKPKIEAKLDEKTADEKMYDLKPIASTSGAKSNGKLKSIVTQNKAPELKRKVKMEELKSNKSPKVVERKEINAERVSSIDMDQSSEASCSPAKTFDSAASTIDEAIFHQNEGHRNSHQEKLKELLFDLTVETSGGEDDGDRQK